MLARKWLFMLYVCVLLKGMFFFKVFFGDRDEGGNVVGVRIRREDGCVSVAFRCDAVVLVGLAIATCCYFKGRRQRQSRSRYSQLLHALSSTASHVSSPVH